MGEPIKYISKIEIKGLWGKFDLEWNLQPDVNVLAGINGSGKSTILKCVYVIIRSCYVESEKLIDSISTFFADCKIAFNNGSYVDHQTVKRHKNSNAQSFYDELEVKFNKMGITDPFMSKYDSPDGITSFFTINQSLLGLNNFLQIDFISTFDTEFKPAEAINKISDDAAKTELDWEIYNLQKRYLKYKLNTAQKTIEAINKGISNGDLLKLQDNQNRFSEIIDSLFEETGKKLNRKEDEVSFLMGEEKISPYQLSSGEKQLLVILMTVLVQDNKNAILFMDEPELSLHFDWQKKLIGYIRELNPNVQIILATHAPAIIREGWVDKVSNVSDLIQPEHKSHANAGK